MRKLIGAALGSIGAALAATMAVPSHALAPDRPGYTVHFTITKNLTLIGKPTMTMLAGSAASIATAGQINYSLDVTVSPIDLAKNDPVKLSVSANIGKRHEPMKFTVVTPLGKDAAMTLRSGRDTYKFDIHVDPA